MVIELYAVNEKDKVLFASWDLPINIEIETHHAIKSILDKASKEEESSLGYEKINGIEWYKLKVAPKNFYQTKEMFNSIVDGLDLVV